MTLRLSLGFIVIITLRLKLHLHINEFDTLAQPRYQMSINIYLGPIMDQVLYWRFRRKIKYLQASTQRTP